MKRGSRSERNPWKIVFIGVSTLALVYFVTGVTALMFPELGIPFFIAAFPVGPQPPPVP